MLAPAIIKSGFSAKILSGSASVTCAASARSFSNNGFAVEQWSTPAISISRACKFGAYDKATMRSGFSGTSTGPNSDSYVTVPPAEEVSSEASSELHAPRAKDINSNTIKLKYFFIILLLFQLIEIDSQ